MILQDRIDAIDASDASDVMTSCQSKLLNNCTSTTRFVLPCRLFLYLKYRYTAQLTLSTPRPWLPVICPCDLPYGRAGKLWKSLTFTPLFLAHTHNTTDKYIPQNHTQHATHMALSFVGQPSPLATRAEKSDPNRVTVTYR